MKRFLKISLPILCLSFLIIGCGKKEEKKETTKVENTKKEEKKEIKNLPINKVVEEKRVYVTAKWAKEFMDKTDKNKYILAEVTWGDEKASPDFLKKHIPTAIHINTDDIEEGPLWNLKKPEVLEKNFLKYGITSDKTLLLYGPNIGADRVAFAALYMGVKDVKIIDGRLGAWEKEGYPVESGSVALKEEKDFKTKTPVHPEYILSLDETVKKLKEDKDFELVSVRSKEEWLGKTSGYTYIPKAGEPKGAVWGESGSGNSGMENYLNKDLTVKPFEDIVKHWNNHGFSLSNDMSFYCGTGWRASTPWLLMYERGYTPTMFDGGWNEWQMHNDLDVQIGNPKDGKTLKVKDLSNDKALPKK